MVESTEFCVRVMGAELQIFDKTWQPWKILSNLAKRKESWWTVAKYSSRLTN